MAMWTQHTRNQMRRAPRRKGSGAINSVNSDPNTGTSRCMTHQSFGTNEKLTSVVSTRVSTSPDCEGTYSVLRKPHLSA
jgi:hypothetical protein